MNILIAEDEKDMLRILKMYLARENFKIFTAQNGEEALDIFYKNKIDIAILDWMMPKINGITVCKEIKSNSNVKILLLTAKGTSEDEFIALKSGADDYLRKPFDPRILILRIKKLLQLDKKVFINNLVIDFEAQIVVKQNCTLNLTKKEFELLKYLIENKGKILTRQMLLNRIWGFDFEGDGRTIDTHIRRLREKIGENLIQTHRGMGYSINEY